MAGASATAIDGVDTERNATFDVTVVQAIVNGELLSYLQQLLQKRKVIFVYHLILQAEEPTKEPIYLAASPNLLTALENILRSSYF